MDSTGRDMDEPGAAARPGPGRLVRSLAPFVTAALATVGLFAVQTDGERAQAQELLDGRQLRLMAPAEPGGGWDQTARELQAALRDRVGRAEVYNVGGAGGTIGLSQYVRLPPEPTELMVTGLIMVGAIESNDSPVTLEQTTPLVRLTTDYEVIVVPADSPVQTTADLVELMREDIGAVSIAGGSAGGVEQITAGLIAADIGADPAEVNYIAHSGGGEALTTLLSGRATAGVSGVSEIQAQIDAGQVRALAVSSAERLPGLPEVPTLLEEGVDVELANWRGVVAPAGISDEDEQALEDLLMEMADSPQWQETLQRRGWGDAALAGPEFEAFLAEETARVGQVLDDIGLG
ncbi:tripartite tricarboxylate transporter substrate binding protein [Allonocardiopsis opalescens]|uniref:Putative tricarboxylic transport membrane protein n=1 Tax=Allonocardiopsis opalescens TaxID=1144618 RepID=A0A2T0Q0E7_9ACTN|nr:tripartite tricarboxylate transporter substrate-binding protein [Allonocardiopsis opalescens]PRX97258.1 putative tricarboxylic transport membrane protein [Allonocardiopsis opalescens]